MRMPICFLLAVCATVACGQTSPEENRTADKRPSPPAAKVGSSTDKTKRDVTEKVEKVVRTEKEWRKILTREQFQVLRMKGTERAFNNKYDRHFEPGTYACAACDQELFSSDTKFNSGCGWPAFYAAQAGDRVVLTPDRSHNMVRTEVTCARCGSHLGHLFDDAPRTPTGQRFCINSVSLKFTPAATKDAPAAEPSTDEKNRDEK